MEATRPHVSHHPRAAAHQPDARRLIAEYEDALSVALAETDVVRASRAFDRADRLQPAPAARITASNATARPSPRRCGSSPTATACWS